MAGSTLVRIPRDAKATLEDMAAQDGLSLSEALSRLIEEARRRRIIESTNQYYAELREDPEAWAQEEEERRLWDATLADGLETE